MRHGYSTIGESMKSVVLQASGMSCAHCVKAVTQVLSAIEGVDIKHVRVGQAEVWMDSAVTDAAKIVERLNAAGYAAVAEVR